MTVIEFKAAVKTDHRKIWFHASDPCRCLSLAEVREHARAILTDDGPDCVLYETDDASYIHVTSDMVS